MTWVGLADGISAACFLLGAFLVLVAAIGVLRFDDLFSRMHAATKPQVLGLVLILLGLGFRLRDPGAIGALVLVGVFQLLTTPIGSHMIGRAAFRSGQVDTSELVVDELTPVLTPDPERPGREPGPTPG